MGDGEFCGEIILGLAGATPRFEGDWLASAGGLFSAGEPPTFIDPN